MLQNINTYTQVSPSTVIPDGTVLGPHASSHESASQEAYAGYNRNALGKPHFLLQLLIGWPIVALVKFAACTCFSHLLLNCLSRVYL